MSEDRRHAFFHLSQRVFNTPLCIHPAKAEVILSVLSERMGLTSIMRLNGDVIVPGSPVLFDQQMEGEARAAQSYETAGYDVEFGVARIEVEGTTVHKLYDLRPFSGMTGYDGIRQNIMEAVNDDRVRAIMLDINSPGGESAGLFDLVDTIYAARSAKPIWAILTENAYSAGYALASAAHKVIVPRTGGTGSIGVLWMHCDISQALQRRRARYVHHARRTQERPLAGNPPLR